jgi:hypothetical protein
MTFSGCDPSGDVHGSGLVAIVGSSQSPQEFPGRIGVCAGLEL